jgi:hypothetical protein
MTLAEANAALQGFLPAFNTRFAIPPADPRPAWRPWPADLDPERVFCFKDERVVPPDNTVHFAGRLLQLRPTPERASWARARVEVHERLDGSLAVAYRGTGAPAPHARPGPPLAPVREVTKSANRQGGHYPGTSTGTLGEALGPGRRRSKRSRVRTRSGGSGSAPGSARLVGAVRPGRREVGGLTGALEPRIMPTVGAGTPNSRDGEVGL